MNLLTGTIREIFIKGGNPMARVSVRGAIMQVPLLFVAEARVGDEILISSGVAISIVRQEQQKENEDVSGHTG
jgi:hydrogenase maturation factor